jgi:hypothetical protein
VAVSLHARGPSARDGPWFARWRDAKHCKQWQATLSTYAEPFIGALPVQAIDTALVKKVLEQKVRDRSTGTPTPFGSQNPRLQADCEVALKPFWIGQKPKTIAAGIPDGFRVFRCCVMCLSIPRAGNVAMPLQF